MSGNYKLKYSLAQRKRHSLTRWLHDNNYESGEDYEIGYVVQKGFNEDKFIGYTWRKKRNGRWRS